MHEDEPTTAQATPGGDQQSLKADETAAGPPDFDGEGEVGVTDFLALLTNWGTCL